MNILTFKKSISSCVMVAYTTLASLVPMGQVHAAPVCNASNPTTAAGQTPGCAIKQFPSGPYAFAKLQWSQIGTISQSPTSGINLSMASGDRVLLSNNRTAAALGLQANQVADVVSLFPTSVPFVFARYNPMSRQMRVDIFKVEKSGSQVAMLQAPFAPAHGGAFAAAMTYATPSDRANGYSPGANPFAAGERAGDDTFHDVKDLAGAQVVVGHAMRMAGASIGLVAVAETRPHQYVTKSGGWLRKKITTHVEGYTKPLWYIATPRDFQPHGVAGDMCAINVANPLDCPQHLLVKSGVVWTQWEGGTLPAFEDMTSNWTQSKKSFTLLAMIVVTFLVVATGGALMVAAGATAGALGPATLIHGLMTATAATAGGALTMSSVLTFAAIEAAVVGGIGGLSGAGIKDAVTAPYTGARGGFEAPTRPDTPAGQSLYDGAVAKFITPATSAVGVRAVTEGLYGVGCAPHLPSTSCGNSGVVPRVDTSTQANNVLFWKDNGKPVVVPEGF